MMVCLVVLAVGIPGSADWPQFRGPTGQGLGDARGLPVSWSDTENVAWKVAVPGLGWSSPAVVAGRIYLTTALPGGNEPRQSLRALCLDADTGATLWDRELFEQRGSVEIHRKNSHASPTPVVEGDRVYVHFGPHGTACVTTGGDVVWTNREFKYGPTHGTGASPALASDVLIIPCDGHDVQYVVGIDKATGKVRWKTPRDTDPTKGFSFSTPLVIDVGGRSQAVCPGSEAVFAYDPQNGREIWRVRYGDGYSVVPRPVFAQGLVYVCTGYDAPQLLAIDPRGKGDVTNTHVRWSTDEAAPHNPSPLVVGGELYTVSDRGVARCVDARTGAERWQSRLGGNFSASPTYADGRIYFQNETGTAIVVKAGTEFEELGRSEFAGGDRTFASYAVDDGALFVRSETQLYRIEKTGAAAAR
jgi:outer membrane protein assembly factor BamB